MTVVTNQRATGIEAATESIASLARSRGLRLGAVGNSIVASATSFWRAAATKSAGQIAVKNCTAVGGAQSSAMPGQVATLDPGANCVLLMEGTNDASGSVSTAQHIANMRATADAIKGRGAVPWVIATPPNDAAYSAAANSMALADRFFAERDGLPFCDPWSRYVDTDGTWTAGASTDNIHPIVATEAQVGSDLWTLTAAGDSGNLLPRSNTGNGLFGSNALLLTDTNADGLPDSWSNLSLTTPTFALAAAAYPFRGNRCTAVVSQSSTGLMFRQASITGVNAGDLLRITGFVSLSTSSNMRVRVFARFSSSGAPDHGCALIVGDTTNTYFSAEAQMPSGTTNIQLYIECAGQVAGAFNGTVGFGGIDIYNVTQNTF